jgi:hypothetical protein
VFVQVTGGARFRKDRWGDGAGRGSSEAAVPRLAKLRMVLCWLNLLISIPLWSRLPVPGVSETGWTLFRSCRPGANNSNNGLEMRRGAPGAPFLLVEVGGVGLVHGIEHIDLSAGCV